MCRIQGDFLGDRAEPDAVKSSGPAPAQPQQAEAKKGQVNIFSGESPAGTASASLHCLHQHWVFDSTMYNSSLPVISSQNPNRAPAAAAAAAAAAVVAAVARTAGVIDEPSSY